MAGVKRTVDCTQSDARKRSKGKREPASRAQSGTKTEAQGNATSNCEGDTRKIATRNGQNGCRGELLLTHPGESDVPEYDRSLSPSSDNTGKGVCACPYHGFCAPLVGAR